MDIKKRITELRALVPIPITEAAALLKNNNYDIQKCASLYKAKSINHIAEKTGCSKEIAETKYITNDYDINRAISSIQEDIYDAHYTPIEGVTRANLLKVREWYNLAQAEDFATAMQYKNIDLVVQTLAQIASLREIGNIIQEAHKIYSKVFEGYSDNDPISEFVVRNKKLDDDIDFMNYWNTYKTKTIKLNEELTRHIRNSK